MATQQGGVTRSGRTVELSDLTHLVDNLGAVLVVALVLQVTSVVVGLVTGGSAGLVVGFALTVGVATLPLAGIGYAYLNDPRRTESLLRRLGRVLAVVFALWGVVLLTAFAFGAYLSGMPAVLTPPPEFYHPVEVVGFFAVPVLGTFGVTRLAVELDD